MSVQTITAQPHIVLLGGSLRAGSRSNVVVAWCAAQCRARGAATTLFTGAELEFPFYRSGGVPAEEVRAFLTAMAAADGVVLASPTYHGTVSGLLKNALDYVNELRDPVRPYLDGRPIGCVAVSLGAQGGGTTLATLRTIGHALRGWPTPLGVALNDGSAEDLLDDRAQVQLSTMLDQVWTLAMANARRRTRAASVERAAPADRPAPATAGTG